VDRTYLYVPPEEKAEVKAAGAHWDDRLKCWHILGDEDPAKFAKWLGEDDSEDEFTITSDEAFVASATIACWKCHASIEVICIYCESGTVSDEPLTRFTIKGLGAAGSALARQLDQWPFFKQAGAPQPDSRSAYANHCSHCGAVQDDLYLHSEPEHPFFSIPRAQPGLIKLTPLAGRVQLSGDESFEV
jgi:hypothetical protein